MYHTWPVDIDQIRLLKTCINVSDLDREANSQEAEARTDSHEPEARSRNKVKSPIPFQRRKKRIKNSAKTGFQNRACTCLCPRTYVQSWVTSFVGVGREFLVYNSFLALVLQNGIHGRCGRCFATALPQNQLFILQSSEWRMMVSNQKSRTRKFSFGRICKGLAEHA